MLIAPGFPEADWFGSGDQGLDLDLSAELGLVRPEQLCLRRCDGDAGDQNWRGVIPWGQITFSRTKATPVRVREAANAIAIEHMIIS